MVCGITTLDWKPILEKYNSSPGVYINVLASWILFSPKTYIDMWRARRVVVFDTLVWGDWECADGGLVVTLSVYVASSPGLGESIRQVVGMSVLLFIFFWTWVGIWDGSKQSRA